MRSILAAPLALACGIAFAQPQSVYRCGDSYSTQPCPGGKAIATDTPVPTAAERQQAAAAARRDARIANDLEKDRLQQEARPAQVYAPPPAPQSKPEPHKWPEKAATRKLDVFTATAPGSKPPKKDKGAKDKAGKGKSGDVAKGKKAEGGKPATLKAGAPAAHVRR